MAVAPHYECQRLVGTPVCWEGKDPTSSGKELALCATTSSGTSQEV
jgi:hypothetical protein